MHHAGVKQTTNMDILLVFYKSILHLRRLPRVLRPRATWAQVWREILNPREVHAKKKNKDGFPFPYYRPVKVYKITGILAAIVK